MHTENDFLKLDWQCPQCGNKTALSVSAPEWSAEKQMWQLTINFPMKLRCACGTEKDFSVHELKRLGVL